MALDRLSLVLLFLIAASGPVAAENGSDAVCGPRCVHRVLEQYGDSPPALTDLIVEMQATVSAGSTFGAISEALTKRGIHCQFVPLGKLDLLAWPEPVVIHLDGNHFAVYERGNCISTRIWNGLEGVQSISWLSLRLRLSDQVLLTSANVIPAHPSYRSAKLLWSVVIAAFGLGLLGVIFVRRSMKGRARKIGVVPTQRPSHRP